MNKALFLFQCLHEGSLSSKHLAKLPIVMPENGVQPIKLYFKRFTAVIKS